MSIENENSITTNEAITVDGFFGEQKITKEDFVKQWTQHASEFLRLVDYKNPEQTTWVAEVTLHAEKIATSEFNRLLVAEREE